MPHPVSPIIAFEVFAFIFKFIFFNTYSFSLYPKLTLSNTNLSLILSNILQFLISLTSSLESSISNTLSHPASALWNVLNRFARLLSGLVKLLE